MPSSGWLAALTRHLSRSPHHHHHHQDPSLGPGSGPTTLLAQGGNGVATVSSQGPDDGSRVEANLPSRPTTPWSLHTLDDEIQRHHHQHNHPPQHQGKAAPARLPSTTTTTSTTTPTTSPTDPHHHYHHHPHTHHHHSPLSQHGESEVAPLNKMEVGATTTTQSSRPTSSTSSRTFSRPASAPSASRPASASSSRPPSGSSSSSRLGSGGYRQPILRSQTQAQAHTPTVPGQAATLPAQVEESGMEEGGVEGSRGHYHIPPVIPPLYDRPLAAPTPSSTRCNTPVWDLEGEKRVRFLEPEVVGDIPSRPPSVNSQYSHIVKNSTRFAFTPAQPLSGDQGGHNPRFCNCPCHFFPLGRRSVGVQVKRTDPEPPRPRHYRLYFTPTTQGLEQVTLPAKSLSLLARALLSQVGLAVVVVMWWVAGAAIFSTVEGAAESETVNRMATLRTDLVLGLATELRQVLPYDAVWRTKIELYMGRLENAVLDAARAGYASRAPTWTMAGALLYSASLTTLVGPGGMTLRTGFSRLFAVLFSLVGAPLVLLLAISAAFTIREGVGRAWAWRCGRGKKGKVSDGAGDLNGEGLAGQYVSGTTEPGSTLNIAGRPQSSVSEAGGGQAAAGAGGGGQAQGQAPVLAGRNTRITPNGPGELPGATVSHTTTTSRPRHTSASADIHQPSRVPALDSTLRSSSFVSTSSREEDIASATVPGSTQTFPNPSQYRTMSGEQPFVGVTPVIQRQGKPGGVMSPYPRRRGSSGNRVPWPVYLGLLVAYIILGLVIFAPIQRWSLPSSVYIVLSTLITLDHDSLGERHLLGTSKIIVPYVVYMLAGLVLVVALVMSVWSSLCSTLVTTGKYLAVVRPTPR